MTETQRRTAAELDMALTNARQTVNLLRSQAQAGRIDLAYLDQRLGSLDGLMTELAEDRKVTVQQEKRVKLYELSRVIGSSLDLQTVLDQVMDAIILLTGAERGFLMLLDDDGKLDVEVARNFDQATIDQNTANISRTIINKVFDSGQAVV